jgi:solute carrier family 25 oxoglutarate transporter 11
MSEPASISLGWNLAFAAVSGSGATVVVQPMDLVKNRMQTNKSLTVGKCVSGIIKNDGILKMWTGLGAGILRQCSYTTVRLGVYRKLEEKYKPKSFGQKLGLGATAGFIGSLFGNPAEVCLIRMTADGNLPKEEQRGYTSVANALSRIIKEEGVLTLWRGAAPTIARAIVVNAAQLGTYSQAKQSVKANWGMEEGIKLHFTAAMISGLVTTIASMPVDITKTRLQNQKFVDGKPEYRGVADVFTKIIRNEGFFALWKGFFPYYFRLGPHTVLTFIFVEQCRNIYLSSSSSK